MDVITLYALILLHFKSPAQFDLPKGDVLAVKTMSLDNRYPVPAVNEVFKQNILLTLAYMQGEKPLQPVEETAIDKPVHYAITLHQGEVFAFHDDLLPEYAGKVVATTQAHFNSQEGFKSDGYLIGDGVCHLASLIDFAARRAGLMVVAPTRHDFAPIPDVPKQYGVSIYASPTESSASAVQNLYITNPLSQTVMIVFDYHDSRLQVTILKQTS